MSDVSQIIQNLDKRVGALETSDIEDSANLTQIKKLYADIEIDVTWTYWLHRYRACGDTQPLYAATCGADAYI